MKLTKGSLLFQWAYFLTSTNDIPFETNLCKLFWRCVLLTPFKFALVLGVASILPVLAFAHQWFALLVIAATVVVMLAVVLVGVNIEHALKNTGRGTLLKEYVKAKKDKVCPLIRIENKGQWDVTDGGF